LDLGWHISTWNGSEAIYQHCAIGQCQQVAIGRRPGTTIEGRLAASEEDEVKLLDCWQAFGSGLAGD